MLKVIVLCLLCGFVNSTDFTQPWSDFFVDIFLNTSEISTECKAAFQNLANRLENNELGALKMVDATAKIPSGLLSGNINQYGDYDECLYGAKGQYCLVEIDLQPYWNRSALGKYRELVHSYYLFKDDFGDPGHRLPPFSMIRWGICLPKQCSQDDLKVSLEKQFGVNVEIREGMCQTRGGNNKEASSIGAWIARIFFLGICSAVALATIADFTQSKFVPRGKVLKCFSLLSNWEQFMKIDESGKQIEGLHGIRALNVLALLMSHKSVSIFFNPFMNRTATIERLSQPWTIVAKNAILYTDCFLLISGLLTANSLLSDLTKTNGMKLKDKVFNRLFRILPNMLAIILFCTYILPSLGEGPMWPTVIDHHSHLCKKYMWRNVLFIHNYFGFRDMCLTHTHQIGIDMQLFLVTPIFVLLLWVFGKVGTIVLVIIGGISTVLRLWVTYQNELSSVIYFGIPISKMFVIADLSYILPTHRATVYLIGVYLAFLLKYSNPNPVLSKLRLATYWVCFLIPFLGSWLGPYHMVSRNYVYNRIEATLISGLYPVFWGGSVAFAIFILNKHKDYLGFLGDLICWKYFQIVTKLAYALYLVQFPVFFYNVGVNKSVDEYQPYYQLQVLETLAIVGISIGLVLCIEMPFQKLKDVLWTKNGRNKTSVSRNPKSG